MTENAVQLAIKHFLPRTSARPKSSALFYEKLATYVSPIVSDASQLLTRVQLAIKHLLPRTSARPKSSALFYEKLATYVSPIVSGLYTNHLVCILTG